MLNPQRLQAEHRAEVNRAHLGLTEIWPTDAAAVLPPTAAGADTYGAWTQVFAAATIAVPFSIVGIVTVPVLVSANTLNAVVDIGVGAGAAEVSIGEVPITGCFNQGAGAYQTGINTNLPLPLEVPAGSRLAVRVRDSIAAAHNFRVYLVTSREDSLVVPIGMVAGRTLQISTLAPATGAFTTVTSGAGVFLRGAWIQLLAATAADSVLIGLGMSAEEWFNADKEFQFQIGIGGGGSEVMVSEFAALIEHDTSVGKQVGSVAMLTRPRWIPGGSRISCRASCSVASTDTGIVAVFLPTPFR